MNSTVKRYLDLWAKRGYPDDIPDEVPAVLMAERLAPSYKAICLAIFRNDTGFVSLGFAPKPSRWYMELKRIELLAKGIIRPSAQMELPL